MSTANAIIMIVAALAYLALLGLALAAAGWIGGRLLGVKELSFRRMLPIGLLQGLVTGFCLLVIAQALQLSPVAGILITVLAVLLVGLGEIKLTTRSTWKAAFKPWGVAAIFQLVLGLPSALLLSPLLAAALNLLFPVS